MTALAPLRGWLEQASARERLSAAAAAVVATGLMTLALVPAPPERKGGVTATGEFRSGGESTDPGVVAPGLTTDGAPGGSAPDASGPGAPGLSGPTSTITHSGGGGGAPRGAFTASDRGVSADTIKVGFTVIDFGNAIANGIVPGIRKDASAAVDALVAYANEHGGVLGRRIELVKVFPDIGSAEDQRKKCVELTETNRVFAVVDSFAFSFETSKACVTAEHKTLLLSGHPGSSRNVRLGYPFHVSLQNDDNRKMKNLVAAAKTAGFFDPENGFKKLGIYEEDCAPSIYDSPTDGLGAYLREAGIKEWTSFRMSCSTSASTPAQAALHFKQEDVSHVLLATRPPLMRDYLDAAHAARFYPEYFASDYYNVVLGGLVDKYEPNGFDGARAVTQTHAGEAAVGKPLPPLAQKCSQIFQDHGVAPVVAEPPHDIGDDIEVLQLCESFVLFLQVAAAAGPNLTRSTWVDALARVGDFPAATTDLARFDRRGKMTGGDTMKLVQWHRDCRCWRHLTDFVPAAG